MKTLILTAGLATTPLLTLAQQNLLPVNEMAQRALAPNANLKGLSAQPNETRSNAFSSKLTNSSLESFSDKNLKTKGTNLGPSEPGGGNAIQAQKTEDQIFLDRFEAVNTQPTTFEALNKKSPLLNSRLEAFDQIKIGLKQIMMKSPAVAKRWSLSSLPLLKNPACVNAHLYVVDTKVVACQTKDFVRVDANWYNGVKEIDRIWMLNHELFVGYLIEQEDKFSDMRNRRAETEITLRRINAAVLSYKNGEFTHWEGDHSLSDFSEITNSYLGSMAEYQNAKASLIKSLPEFCQMSKEMLSITHLTDLQKKWIALSLADDDLIEKLGNPTTSKSEQDSLIKELNRINQEQTDLKVQLSPFIDTIQNTFAFLKETVGTYSPKNGINLRLDQDFASTTSPSPIGRVQAAVDFQESALKGMPSVFTEKILQRKLSAIIAARATLKGQFGCQ